MSIKREKSDLEGILFKVFMNYSVFGARYNVNYLRVQKFISMCSDAGILDSKLNPQSLDLLFRSVNNRNPNMQFQTFLEITLRLAEIRDSVSYKNSPLDTYSKLIRSHFLPLAGQIVEKREEVTDEILQISDDCKLIMHSIFKGLKHIYSRNFPWEEKPTEDVSSQSQKSLELLLREFDIYPSLLSKNKVHAI